MFTELIGGQRQSDYTFVYISIFIIFMTIILVWAFYPKTNSYTISTTSLNIPKFTFQS